jgi:hypothetical protein
MRLQIVALSCLVASRAACPTVAHEVGPPRIRTKKGRAGIWAGGPIVRNIFKILGCQEREDATQKSIDKAKFTSAGGCTPGGAFI